ncbi:MAG: hypothetical protein V1743_04710 [Nanoarchaeota archaeon]
MPVPMADSPLFIRFLLVKEVLADFEKEMKSQGKSLFRKTGLGYWGTSNAYDLFDFFQKIHLEQYRHFLDLGSGDGRMVFIASLFTKASGIEMDDELYAESTRLQKIILARKTVPEKNITLIHGDFMAHSFSAYDFLMSYYDKAFTPELEAKIQGEFKGDFYLYNNIYTPGIMKKGKTVWIGQMPIIKFEVRS